MAKYRLRSLSEKGEKAPVVVPDDRVGAKQLGLDDQANDVG